MKKLFFSVILTVTILFSCTIPILSNYIGLAKVEEKNILGYSRNEDGEEVPIYRDRNFFASNWSVGEYNITSSKMIDLYVETGDERFYDVALKFKQLSEGVARANCEDIKPDNVVLYVLANGIRRLPLYTSGIYLGGIIVLLVIIIPVFLYRLHRQENINSVNVYLPEQPQEPDSPEPEPDSDVSSDLSYTPHRKIFKFFFILFAAHVFFSALSYKENYGYSFVAAMIFDCFLYSAGAGLCCLIYACMFAGNSSPFDRTTLTEIGEQILKRKGEKELLDFAESSGEEELLNLRSRYLQEDEPSPAILGELQIAYFKSLKADNPEAVYRTAGELGLSYAEAVNIAEAFGDELDINVAQQLWSTAYYEREQALKHPAAPEE